MVHEPLACISIDLEPDFTELSNGKRHYGLFDTPGHFDRFSKLIAQYEVELTCFVVGNTLRDRPDYIRRLSEMGAEFGSHSLTHSLKAQRDEHEVRGGIHSFSEFFGHLPQGYRSPRGKLTRAVLETLENEGILYDSSVIPSVRPGTYWNLRKPTQPFRWRNLSLVELPIAVVPYIRLPMALSYMKLIGANLYSTMLNTLGYPSPLVFLFHPMDLTYSSQAFEGLSVPWKLAYARNRSNSWEILESFLLNLTQAGYCFAHMSKLYEKVSHDQLPECL